MQSKKFKWAFAAAFVFAAQAVSAQGFDGANVGFEWEHDDDGDGFTVSLIEASADVSYLVSAQFGLQFGLGYSQEVDSSDPFLDFIKVRQAELHGFFDPTPATRIGALVSFDDFNEGDRLFAVEGVYLSGNTRVEARLGRFKSDVEPADLYEIYAEYALPSGLTLLGSVSKVDYEDGFGHRTVTSAGVSYTFTGGPTLYGKYGRYVNDFGGGDVYNGEMITIGVTMDLGGPANRKMFTYSPFQ